MGAPRGVAQARSSEGVVAAPLPGGHVRLIGAGRPLESGIRQAMESLLQADFSNVRVHEGPAAQAIGALAFTLGETLYFAPGLYNTRTREGLELLGHELTHVVQQRDGRVVNPYGQGVAIVQDPALEEAADQMGRRIADAMCEGAGAGPAAGRAVGRVLAGSPLGSARTQRAARDGGAVQRYEVAGSSKIYANMPARRPWFGYPYAVATANQFLAQTPRVGVTGVHAFLDANGSGTAWVQPAGGGLSLRISDDGNMAIENTDLTTRQPKVFFATQAVVNAANTSLASVNSEFRLVTDNGNTITVLTGWSSQKVLRRVTPRYNGGSADHAPQNCNAIAAAVMGWGAEWVNMNGLAKGLAVAKIFAPVAGARYDRAYRNNSVSQERVDELRNDIAREYVRIRDYGPVHREGANEFAAPDIGHAFMIASVGHGPDLGGGRRRLTDYASGETRTVSWTYHFGGVVARSGTDRVTLENYARGDNRVNNADPRWYFQMYGEIPYRTLPLWSERHTFHEAHAATKGYANPITIVLTKS